MLGLAESVFYSRFEVNPCAVTVAFCFLSDSIAITHFLVQSERRKETILISQLFSSLRNDMANIFFFNTESLLIEAVVPMSELLFSPARSRNK
jgi:hypothetical protein